MSSTADIIARAKARQAREAAAKRAASRDSDLQATPGPGPSRSSSPPPSDFSDFVTPRTPPVPPQNKDGPTLYDTAAGMAVMKAAGERAAKTRKLNETAQADFARFLETPHLLEREALAHLAVLEVRSLLQENTQAAEQRWEPSRDLTKTIKKYIRAFLLMPNLQYYGGSLSATVIEAMRKSNVAGLPDDDALLKDVMSHPISVDKNTIKSALKQAMNAKKKSERNLAAVAAKIIQSFGVPVEPTLSMFYRLAIIRNEILNNHPDNNFWREVDKALKDYHTQSTASFVICMQELFNQDVEKYGDPAKTDFKLASNPLPEKAPKWLKNVHELASTVRRLNDTSVTKKRRRVVDDDQSDEEDGDDDNTNGEGSKPRADENENGDQLEDRGVDNNGEGGGGGGGGGDSGSDV